MGRKEGKEEDRQQGLLASSIGNIRGGAYFRGKDEGKGRERRGVRGGKEGKEEDLVRKILQGPEFSFFIRLFPMLLAKNKICNQQKNVLQDYPMFSRKLFNAFANFILSSSFPFFSPNQKHSLSKNHHSIAPTPNHLTEKRKKEEKTSSFPHLSDPIQPFCSPPMPHQSHPHPSVLLRKPPSPIPHNPHKQRLSDIFD